MIGTLAREKQLLLEGGSWACELGDATMISKASISWLTDGWASALEYCAQWNNAQAKLFLRFNLHVLWTSFDSYTVTVFVWWGYIQSYFLCANMIRYLILFANFLSLKFWNKIERGKAELSVWYDVIMSAVNGKRLVEGRDEGWLRDCACYVCGGEHASTLILLNI